MKQILKTFFAGVIFTVVIVLFSFNPLRTEGSQIIVSGTTTTISNGIKYVFVDPASLLAAHTITLPASPSDRDEVWILFGGTLTTGGAVVTALTLAANSGHTLVGSLLTTAVGGDAIKFIYRTSNAKWYKF